MTSTNDEREGLARAKAINTVLADLLLPLIPDPVERIERGNLACRTIMDRLASLPAPAPAEASTLPGEGPETMRIKLNITEQEARDMTRVARWERDSMEALEAPPATPAVESGEVVAYAYRNEDGLAPVAEVVSFVRWTADNRVGWDETPLYASPQAPATGGDAVGKILCWDHEIREPDCTTCQSETAALSNHSPDAGGVGDAAGVAELVAMLTAAVPNELGGGTFDHSPEEIGTHVMEHYRAILAALNPADAEGGGGA